MAEKKQKRPIHAGHRQRMHERVRKYGLNSLAEHEVLEYLLYFTNPRGDTNPTAHALLERFGDLAGVLEASEEELCEVSGVGPAAARLLHLMPQVSGCYHCSRLNDSRQLRTTDQMGSYLLKRFRGAREERALLVALDKHRRVTSTTWLGEGSDVEVALPVRQAIAQAVRARAHSAILCHNHPDGNVLPSRHDIEATAELARGMYLVGVELLDHIIVTEGEYLSLRQRSELPTYGRDELHIFPSTEWKESEG